MPPPSIPTISSFFTSLYQYYRQPFWFDGIAAVEMHGAALISGVAGECSAFSSFRFPDSILYTLASGGSINAYSLLAKSVAFR
jgi:hypothetical protein